MLGFCRNMAGVPQSQPKIHQKWHKRSHKRTVVLWTVTKVMILQRWEVKIINTTISLTPDETKLKSPVETWLAVIKFNCYVFDLRSSVKSFQHLHLKIFTAKDEIEDFPSSNSRCTWVLHCIEVCVCLGVTHLRGSVLCIVVHKNRHRPPLGWSPVVRVRGLGRL